MLPYHRIFGHTLILTGLSIISLGYLGCTPKPLPGQKERATSCKVLKVFDGDTVGCDLNNNQKLEKPKETIRLLGIDTPEMHYSKKNKNYQGSLKVDEPFAKRSGQWTRQKLLNQFVALEFDQVRHDKYRRTLAYIYLCKKVAPCSLKESVYPLSINEMLLRKGFAKVLLMGKNRRYEHRFVKAERLAQTNKDGIWSNNSDYKD